MSSTIGDGMVALALAAGIVGYNYVKDRTRRKRLEIIHQERLVAMEKGIIQELNSASTLPHPATTHSIQRKPRLAATLFLKPLSNRGVQNFAPAMAVTAFQ